jgi:hypothetical protein
MKKALVAALLTLCSCVGPENPADRSFRSPPIDGTVNLIGKTWLYDRTLNFTGLTEYTPTTQTYSYVTCDGDTTILGKKYFVVREENLAREQLDVDTQSSTCFIHVGNDSVIIVIPDQSPLGGPVVSLYKRTPAKRFGEFADGIWDKYAALLLPLSDTSSWYLRGPTGKALAVKRKCTGGESVAVPAGTFDCYKILWDWSEASADTSGFSQTDWISTYGLVKSVLDGGRPSTLLNDWGDSICATSFFSTTTLLSTSDGIPSNVGPMLPADVIDTLKRTVRDFWRIANYKRWLDNYIASKGVTTFDQMNTTEGISLVPEFLEDVWGDSLTDLQSVLSEFSKPFPSDPSGFHDYVGFLETVAYDYGMMPGWVDCDLDVQAGEISKETPPFRFGNSQIRSKLMKTVYP